MKTSKAGRSEGTSHDAPKAGKAPGKVNKLITRPRRQGMIYVGLDVHKKSVQVAAVDRKGDLLLNEKIPSDFESVTEMVSELPKARYVMESSSVWYGLYRHMTDTLRLDVVLSNPYASKVIAASLKKTDRIDAHKLADLLRGGYVAGCHVPDAQAVDYRQLTRHRSKIMRTRARMKNYVHGITLQLGFKSKAPYPFSPAHIAELEAMGDYKIDSYLREIRFQNGELAEADAMVREAVRSSPEARPLTSIPGGRIQRWCSWPRSARSAGLPTRTSCARTRASSRRCATPQTPYTTGA